MVLNRCWYLLPCAILVVTGCGRLDGGGAEVGASEAELASATPEPEIPVTEHVSAPSATPATLTPGRMSTCSYSVSGDEDLAQRLADGYGLARINFDAIFRETEIIEEVPGGQLTTPVVEIETISADGILPPTRAMPRIVRVAQSHRAVYRRDDGSVFEGFSAEMPRDEHGVRWGVIHESAGNWLVATTLPLGPTGGPLVGEREADLSQLRERADSIRAAALEGR